MVEARGHACHALHDYPSEIRISFMLYNFTSPKIEVLSAAIWLYTRAIFDLGTYDDFTLPCISKNDLSKGCYDQI